MKLKYVILILSSLLFCCDRKNSKDNNEPRDTVKLRKPEAIRLLDNREFKVTASSELKGKKDGQYSPYNAFDNDLKTAWAEGNKSNGVNEWIEVTFAKKQLIKEIIIENGYQKSKETYIKNNRMSSFSLYVDGKKTFIRDYSREIGKFGRFRLNQFAKKIRIQIEKVEEGTQYNDLCISDIKFDFEDNTFQSEIKQKTKSNKDDTQIIFSLDKDSKRLCILDQKMIFSDLELISSKVKTLSLFNHNDIVDFHAEKLRSAKNSQFPFYIIRIYLQYEYDRDTYLHFIPKDHLASDKIIFHESWGGVDGSFEYPEWEIVNLNRDAYDDIFFKKGECFNACESFKSEVRAITKKSSDNLLTLEFE